MRALLARMRPSFADYARTSVAVFALLILARAYTFAIAGVAHALPAGSAAATARGGGEDLSAALFAALLFAVPVLGTALYAPRAARVLHRVLVVAVALGAVALAQYFAVNLVPLGADLFGYSIADIRTTVFASTGVSAFATVAYAVFACLAWILTRLAARIPMPTPALAAFGCAVAANALVPGALALRPASFARDSDFKFAESASLYFGRGAAAALADRLSAPSMDAAGPYPFLHPAQYGDVLGPLLRAAPSRPNIVFIVVEGLGRDFVGQGARFGGFTPFLDSLAGRSLFWSNCLSSTGRTFGVLPSLLASLPYGASGFSELGARMPYHQSLISLLRERGYASDYFSGTDGHFDKIDTFLDREGVDRFVDQRGFGAGYAMQPGERGFSWGYADADLFKRSLDVLGAKPPEPRVDVYLTITTHEPFIPPDAARWGAEFERRITAMPADENKRAAFRANRAVFQTLLYTDNAVREFFAAYSARPDFTRTIFIITGDHRLVPVPATTRLDQFRVPLIIASPLVAEPRRFNGVATHLDLVPTLLGYLSAKYAMHFPDSAAWRGSALDTAPAFHGSPPTALMRTKNDLTDFIDGNFYLSRGVLYKIDEHLDARLANDAQERARLAGELALFVRHNRFATSGDHVYPPPPEAIAAAAAAARDDSVYRSLGLARATPVEAFDAARAAAASREYETARIIARRILRESPNYHDARALIGRTLGWERRFDESRTVLGGLRRRAPEYAGGWAATIDLNIWEGRGAIALAMSDTAIVSFPRDAEVLLARARALEVAGRRAEALAALDALSRIDPKNTDAEVIRKRLVSR